jgi:hypothetical protein
MKVAIERGWLEMQRSGTVHAGSRRAGLMADTGLQRKFEDPIFAITPTFSQRRATSPDRPSNRKNHNCLATRGLWPRKPCT